MHNLIDFTPSSRRIEVPPKARALMEMLLDAGFEVYCVGGCVRDSFMGISPADWDLCTNALPHQIKEVFSALRVVETGIKHGTLTVILEEESFEVTTFRRDGDYLDCRRPESVEFVSSLREDLSRRDFTMNALAADINGVLFDPFGGTEDIDAGIIKCVGEAKARFEEDALRLLRAMRFAARFGFDIEETTKMAILASVTLLKNISAERISKELCGVLAGRYCGRILQEYSEVFAFLIPEIHGAVNTAHPCVSKKIWEVSAAAISNTPPDIPLRLALLYYNLGLPAFLENGEVWGYWEHSARIAESSLKSLRFDNLTITTVVQLIRNIHITLSPHKPLLLRYLSQLGPTALERIVCAKEALDAACGKNVAHYKDVLAMLSEIERNADCYLVSHLALGGQELLAIGFKAGKELGEALNALLEAVMDGRVQNSADELLALAEKMLQK